jgi:catechol 2,3-dioxygenase-like lactoylglutathione lyase family enzyme
MTQGIAGLDHVNLTVADFEESVAWYARVFGFELVERGMGETGPWGVIRSGEAMLCLYEHPECSYEEPEPRRGRGLHTVNHVGFRIRDEAEWLRTVEREKLVVEPMAWPHSKAWYLCDPTGYEIEVVLWNGGEIAFPPLRR